MIVETKFTIPELKNILQGLMMPSSGRKQNLIDRVVHEIKVAQLEKDMPKLARVQGLVSREYSRRYGTSQPNSGYSAGPIQLLSIGNSIANVSGVC